MSQQETDIMEEMDHRYAGHNGLWSKVPQIIPVWVSQGGGLEWPPEIRNAILQLMVTVAV